MIRKVIISIVLVIISFVGITVTSNRVYGSTVDETILGARDFVNTGSNSQVNESEFQNVSKFIFNILISIAIIMAIIIGIFLGIQFMTASVEEKAKVKEGLLAYVVSCVVIFGAFGIWRLAINVLSEW